MNRDNLQERAVTDYNNAKTLAIRHLGDDYSYNSTHTRAAMRTVDRWHRHPHIDNTIAARCAP
jgi:hypothetical protein